MKILVTGTAGFIGFFVAQTLLERGDEVIGLDNINDYYEVDLKYDRLDLCGIKKESINYGKPVLSHRFDNYHFYRLNLEDRDAVLSLFKEHKFHRVCHLAAQAGVRYSITHPFDYINSNIVGFMSILEGCRQNDVEHLVFASSSSIYGLNKVQPFSVHHNVDHPVSLYAASKKSNELMAHTYASLYKLPVTGLRFFSVYGPWGRPDMAYFQFTKAIFEGSPIDVFNYGNMERDNTYIDDVVTGVIRVLDKAPCGNASWDEMNPDPSSSPAPYKVYNIGNNTPVKLMDFIKTIETACGKEAKKNMVPMQPGDIYSTYADVNELEKNFGYRPDTPIDVGIGKFVQWYKSYYKRT
ncbi:MAG: NAD-dependent epimerase [Spirochaetales bacterium]|nr:NAD-dependent epimerase [Spirochaetales bacterium]